MRIWDDVFNYVQMLIIYNSFMSNKNIGLIKYKKSAPE